MQNDEKIMLVDVDPLFDVKKPAPPKKKSSCKLLFCLIAMGLIVLFLEGFTFGYLLGKGSARANLPAVSLMQKKKLLLISIDGFRFDYIMRGRTPNLASLALNGFLSRLVPQFPSYTFPNHYSMITGLYPESHGIVSNAFFDPATERYFYFTDSSTTMHTEFWNAEPIWNTNQRQGGKSAVLHYPGSDVLIDGNRPHKYQPFTDQITSEERVKIMLEWMESEKDINLAVLYFDEVDHAGHVYGPDSLQVTKSLKSVDRAIGGLFQKMKENGSFDSYNIMIVSDHGMAKASDSRRIMLDRLVPDLNEMVAWADYGPVASFIPKPEHKYRLGVALKRAIKKHHLPVRLYTKETMPSAYHYTENKRIPPYVLEAKAGWSIDSSEISWHPKGHHGYGRSVRDMDGIFIGYGPAFTGDKGEDIKFHSNLDVYPLMCQLLDIEAKPNNGTLKLASSAISITI